MFLFNHSATCIKGTLGTGTGEMLDKLITHLLGLLWACNCILLAMGCVVSSLSLFPINLLNLLTCLSLTLINLNSLTFFMKSVHFSIVVVVTNDDNLDLHLSSLIVLSWRMSLIPLTPILKQLSFCPMYYLFCSPSINCRFQPNI